VNDDVLIIFEGSRKKTTLVLFLSIGLVAFGLFMVSEGKWFGWLTVGFFGLGIPASLFMLRPNGIYLKLDKSGIEMKTAFKPMKLKWTDVKSFYVGKIYNNKMIGILYSSSFKKMEAGRKAASVLSGMEGALPNSFKNSPEEICEELNLWKKRFGHNA
jgi:hypothetical protein